MRAQNLCAKISAGVSDDAATFTVIVAVGLQGVRLFEPAFGETIVAVRQERSTLCAACRTF
jgi:hypothetical protein